MEPDLSQSLAAALEDVIWLVPPGLLQASEPAIRALVAAAGCDLAALLEKLADETLALAVQKGFLRNLAFEEWVVNRYEKALFHWFHQRTGDAVRAQDMLQDLYLKLLSKTTLDKYNPDQLFCPWLWTLARRLVIDEWRRHKKQKRFPERELVANGPSPPEEAAARELEMRVAAIVKNLPELQRRVFEEARNGTDADRIAQLMAVSKPRVFQLLFKARRFVERAIQSEADDMVLRKEVSPNHPIVQEKSPS
jgi:RNA polymerase sigma-70 factor (ECF subfamily)